MTVGVSVVVHRSPLPELRRLLDSLARQDGVAVRVQLRLNAGSAAEEHAVRQMAAETGLDEVGVVATRDNAGFSAAHNRQLADLFAQGCADVLVVNPDVVLGPLAVRNLVEEGARRPGSLLGPLLELADGNGRGEGRVDTAGIRWTASARHVDDAQGQPLMELGQPRRVSGLSGACLLVSRPAWERLTAPDGEFFDEHFFAYREDADLALRAARLGVQCWLVPAAHSLHGRRQRGTERGRDAFVDRLGVRNRFLLAAKHGRHRPGRWPLPLVRDVVVAVGAVLTEPQSRGAVKEAWELWPEMRRKRRRLEEHARRSG